MAKAAGKRPHGKIGPTRACNRDGRCARNICEHVSTSDKDRAGRDLVAGWRFTGARQQVEGRLDDAAQVGMPGAEIVASVERPHAEPTLIREATEQMNSGPK